MKLLDPQHPFYAPLWRRVVIVVLCLGWALVELSRSELVWAGVFAVCGLFCAYQFFVVFRPPEETDSTDDTA